MQDNTFEKKKINNKLLFIIGGIILFVLCILFVFLLVFFNNKKTIDIINNLGIDDYFKYIFTNKYEKNVNLLDINNEQNIFMYYFYNDNTKIYKIDFRDPTFEGDLFLTYANYSDYMKYHKKVFGVESKHEMGIYDIYISSLEEQENGIYYSSSPVQCRLLDAPDVTDNCYIKLTKDTGISGDVVLSKLNREDNVITGMASFNSKSEYFEFVFEENNGEYIIKSLKIVDNIE